jgi:amino acid transporter
MSQVSQNSEQSSGHKISFIPAVLMNINIIIGAGIYYSPKIMTEKAAHLGFWGWPLIALMLLPVIVALAQATWLFPGNGGFFEYGRKGISPYAGFLAIWFYLLGFIGSCATIATVIKDNLANTFTLIPFNDYSVLFFILIVATVSLLNLLDIALISSIQSYATVLKLFPLFLVSVIMWFFYDPSKVPTLIPTSTDFSNILATTPIAIFAYWGFESCCSIGAYLKGGPQQVGKVLLTAFFASMTLYTLFHLGSIWIMGPDQLLNLGVIKFPQFLGVNLQMEKMLNGLIVGCILLSFINTFFGIALTNITNLHTIASNNLILGGEFLKPITKLLRPYRVVMVHGILLLMMILLVNSSAILLAISNIGTCLALSISMVAVVIELYRNKKYFKFSFCLLSLPSLGVLIYFSWTGIHPDFIMRLAYCSPLILGLLVGTYLYWGQRKKLTIEGQHSLQ